jgi:Fur family peroxide stress response transcriptional regulator
MQEKQSTLSDRKISIGSLKEFLINEGIHPSYQRLRIYEFLAKYDSHPTVDTIYNSLLKEIPTLSKTTVYNTLNLFQRKGIVCGLTIDENEIRYDANTKPHAHFKCKRCGTIFDIEIDSAFVAKGFVCRHMVCEKHLYLKGVCCNCMEDVPD